jgi:hypothetical protein
MRRTSAVDLGLLLIGLLIIYVASPLVIEGDGSARSRALSRLLADGSLDRTPYSLVGPLGSAPLWWIGTALASPEWWLARYNLLLFVAGLAAFYLILTPAIEHGTVVRFLLILTVGSMFPHHLGRYYGEVFTALMVGLGIALVSVRGAYWGWLLAMLGAANTPATIPALALVCLAWAWRTRDARHLLPIVLAAALVTGESWLRRGDPFATGYEGNRGAETVLPFSGRPGFSYPFLLGVISILFSFGKGLLLFAPGLLAIPRQLADRTGVWRTTIVLWTLFLAGLIGVYAKWWSWYGGQFWGPRFFLFASIPAALALAGWSRPRTRSPLDPWLATGALVWSCWVGANGLVWRSYGGDVCTADHYALEFLCWYVPEFSPLFGPLYRSRALDTMDLVVLAFFAAAALWLVASGTQGARADGPAPNAERPTSSA